MSMFNNTNNDDIDAIADLMRGVQIDHTKECIICRNSTYATISDMCPSGCRYVCHIECLQQWIKYKIFRECIRPSCPMCSSPYADETIVRMIE